MRTAHVAVIAALVAVTVPALAPVPSVAATAQNDAGTGADAGGALAVATRVNPAGRYEGFLAGGADADDYYAFTVPLGGSINVEWKGVLQTGSLIAGDNERRLSFQLLGPGGVLLDTPNTNQGDARVTLLAAPAPGDYYLRVTSEWGFTGSYGFCFLPAGVPCPDFGLRRIDFINGGSLRDTTVRVLVVPPTHGDLGNPLGPNVLDYLDATLTGIHRWETSIDAFVADHPEYAYLDAIDIDVIVADPDTPVHLDGFDMKVVFVETSGPMFRGFAGQHPGWSDMFPGLCVPPSNPNSPVCVPPGGAGFHDSGRYFVLSLFAASPRAGQLVADYPEWNDLEGVTMHEFAHSFGLGHSTTWTAEHGPDLMNSPAPFVYGDGSPVGDGGERTPRKCPSSLDLYGLAVLYRWLPGGTWQGTGGSTTLPAHVPYRLYC